MQSNIERKYNKLCHTRSDINEHLPTLFKYASGCESIFETGVRGCVSSWALISGLLNNNKPVKKILIDERKYQSNVYEKVLNNNLDKLNVDYVKYIDHP